MINRRGHQSTKVQRYGGVLDQFEMIEGHRPNKLDEELKGSLGLYGILRAQLTIGMLVACLSSLKVRRLLWFLVVLRLLLSLSSRPALIDCVVRGNPIVRDMQLQYAWLVLARASWIIIARSDESNTCDWLDVLVDSWTVRSLIDCAGSVSGHEYTAIYTSLSSLTLTIIYTSF